MRIWPLPAFPEIRAGDDLPAMIARYDERVAGLGPSTFVPERARAFALKLDALTERLLTRS